MLRNASIRTRVLAILALPLIVLLAFAGTRIDAGVRTARQAEQLTRLVRTQAAASSVVGALDAERRLSAQLLSGDLTARASLLQARAVTDPLLSADGAALAEVDPTGLDRPVRDALDAALSAGQRVRALRAEVDRDGPTAAAVSSAYDSVITDQVSLPDRLAGSVDGSRTAAALRASTDLEVLAQLLVDERDQGAAALADGVVSADERLALAGVQAQEDAARTRATSAASQAGTTVPALGADLQAARASALGAASGGRSSTTSAQWTQVVDADAARLAPARTQLRAVATRGVQAQEDAARRSAWLNALAVIVGLLVPLVLALLVARSVTEPLRALTAAAAAVRERLPRLVEQAQGTGGRAGTAEVDLPVLDAALGRRTDEVGRLAAAFDEVNATSVTVAREQAALREAISATFVTLARRDQALLGRQLSFIDGLERAQDDPALLDELFVIDHLATRMRRNAESLLVLAGLESGRRLRAPLALSDVVRTATSEVEDYRRVHLALGADPSLPGHLALTAAHLVAELLENALVASDPSTRVVVESATAPDGGLLVRIVDEGIGMGDEQRAAALARLADPSATAVLGASELGFFVVGRLARRLGASVDLRAGVLRGTVVEVRVPIASLVGGSVTGSLPAVPAAASAVPAPSAAASGGPLPRRTPTPRTEVAAAATAAPASGVPAVGASATSPAGGAHPASAPGDGATAGGPAAGRPGVFAGFRSRRSVAAGPPAVRPAPAAAAGAGATGSGPAVPPAASTAPAPAAGAPAAPGAGEPLAGAGYTPVSATTGRSSLPTRSHGRGASTGPTLVPFTPEPGESQPQTRRERRAVETGRISAVAASAVTAEAGAGGGGYRPTAVAPAEAPALARRRHSSGASPVGATAPRPVPAPGSAPAAPGVPAGPSSGASDVWVTPPHGQRAVSETSAPRRRDPAQVRDLLAGYHSGVARGRRGAVPEPAGAGAAAPDAEGQA